MSIRRLAKFAYLAYLAKPASERPLYRALRGAAPTSILEIGIGNARRALRMLDLLRMYQPQANLRYAGVDLFESRPVAESGLSLKQAHQLLTKRPGLQVRLLPGDAYTALARAANSLTHIDVVVVSAEMTGQSLERAWFYVPRMLHPESLVFVEEVSAGGRSVFRRWSLDEVRQRAESERMARRQVA